MSNNVKKEDKWVLYFRDDQCRLIIHAMMHIAKNCDQRMRAAGDFDQFTAAQVKERAEEIANQITDITT